jgi:hypothetical protein
MISHLHLIVIMIVFLSVLLSFSLKLQLILKLIYLASHTVRHVLAQVTATISRYLLFRVEILQYLYILQLIIFKSLIKIHISLCYCFMLADNSQGALKLSRIRIILVGVSGIEDVYELVCKVNAVIH